MNKKIFYKAQKTDFVMDTLEKDGSFCGYASVFDCVDYHNDQVLPGAFSKSLIYWKESGSLPKMLWQHSHSQPIGEWLDMYEDDVGLFVKGQLLIETSAGKDAYSLLKKRIVDGLSIGYVPQRVSFSEKGHQLIHEVDLHEVSLVTFAANPKAKVSHIKKQSVCDLYSCRLETLTQRIERMSAF